MGGLLYGTGAGGVILDNMKGLPSACASELGNVNPSVSKVVCGMAGQFVSAMTSAGNAVGAKLDDTFAGLLGGGNNIGSGFSSPSYGRGGQAFDLTSLISGFDMSSLAALASSDEALAGLLQQGPTSVGVGGNSSQQLQAALDSFSIGQRFLAPGSSHYQPSTGISWMQQGASQNEYGLLPQLSLGSLYMQGGQGVAADPQAALAYYSQALQSVQTLQGSNQPGAQQVLGTLPVPPDQLQKEIIAAIRVIKGK